MSNLKASAQQNKNQESEKTTYGMGENILKIYIW